MVELHPRPPHQGRLEDPGGLLGEPLQHADEELEVLGLEAVVAPGAGAGQVCVQGVEEASEDHLEVPGDRGQATSYP